MHIERRAVKELEKTTSSIRQIILEKISTILSMQPFPKGDNPKRLKGVRGFRLRIGDYRVIYTVEKNLILIYAIRHRKDAYRY